MTIHGFDRGDLGKSNEQHLCTYVHNHVGVTRSMVDVLRLDGASAAWLQRAQPGGLEPAIDVVSLDDILGVVMLWRVQGSETGIDRIWLTAEGLHPTTQRRQVTVDGLQLTTGSSGAKMTAGVLSSRRALALPSK
jgi:hypothetical protein